MRHQLRQPRVAELVAGQLRDRILDGEFAPGDRLPTQDQLFEEFQVSMPSIREALRILETEGLIKVLRGNVGGAEVQVPDAGDAGYSLALVLQSRAVPLDDVNDAIRSFEPRAAAACAQRTDRARTVLPALQANVDEARAALDDPERFVQVQRAFHEVLVATCGNETMGVVLGSLERLWSAQSHQVAERTLELGEFAAKEVRSAMLAEHVELVERIAAGDAEGAEAVARRHLSHPERSAAFGRGITVNATALKGIK